MASDLIRAERMRHSQNPPTQRPSCDVLVLTEISEMSLNNDKSLQFIFQAVKFYWAKAIEGSRRKTVSYEEVILSNFAAG